MGETIKAGLKLVAEMLDEETVSRLRSSVGSTAFGARLGELSLDFAFAKIWTRPGLTRRERSFVTLGILIASRSAEELKIHTQIALRNGCTVQELEEVLCQASVYAGFPAAASASGIMGATLREKGHLETVS
ncbi:Carboxymuconolactone decarboxylase [Burkholderia sp. H160]|nr:Carboxymuconolactone decarboxylase [Burkholderia sp. H160]